MAFKSAIEWTEATWNPWHGCHKVSQGCRNCYMFRDKAKYGQDPNVVVRSKTKFYDPLKWEEPRKVFTCSWSDFFIEEADPWRDEAFAIMALTPQHTYQVLTKRPDRMLEYLSDPTRLAAISIHMGKLAGSTKDFDFIEKGFDILSSLDPQNLILPNVWLGTSVEDQKTADERIPELLKIPAKVRFLSMEPLLGPVDLQHWVEPVGQDSCIECGKDEKRFMTADEYDRISWTERGDAMCPDCGCLCTVTGYEEGLNWVIVGGESGPNARPVHPDWVRSIRDQCQAAGVPFFFKQWGEWWPIGQMPDGISDNFYGKQYPKPRRPEYDERPAPKAVESVVLQLDGTVDFAFPKGAMTCFKVGKAKAGRLLDGREWNEFPKIGQ